jgi:TonB-dependent receptor
MQKNRNKAKQRAFAGRRVLFGTTLLAGMVAQAFAQQSPPADAPKPVETLVVTGYRASLESSTKDKREATGFVDSVTAEEIGKFPDSNIAESLNRIPGVLISREITGEGLNIQIRGLGQSFTKILLNGAPVAVASTGRTDNQNTNREVDLDLLPADLFRKLTVYKSPAADMIEGGAAGIVDMRSARPFDNPGRYAAVSLQGVQNTVADKWGNRGSVIASQTWGDTWGILGGVAWSNMNVRTTGFETIGWTNPNLSATQSTSATRNNTGGGNWTIPGTVPVNAGNGLVAGQVVDQAFLLQHNPGRTIQQIDNAIIPRLGRNMDEQGTKDKVSGVVSFEYRPNDALHIYVDSMYAKKKNDLIRQDMNWVGRNGAMIPLNMQVDREDCSNGCVVTQATYANAQFFLEFRPYIEDVNLKGVNPGFEWQINKTLKLDGQANWTKSEFHRESPTVLPITAGSSGVTVNYNGASATPSITTNIDLNNPANFIWAGGRVNQQEEFRDTETKGVRANLTWGDKAFNLKTGLAFDDISRTIRAKDNSGAWQAATCGNNPSLFLLGPNGAPGCDGANTPGTSMAALYPGFGTGYTAGQTNPLVNRGSLIPLTALPGYLSPGPGFVTLDWNRFSQDSHYGDFVASAPDVGSSNTGASAGYIREKMTGFYLEANGETQTWELPMRYNAGLRYVKTDQTVGGFISIPDPRNVAQNLLNGGKYPNIDQNVNVESSYHNALPSGSLAWNVDRDVVFRASASRSMTRADPNALRPGINFSSPSADVGTVGNETLKPYLSNNLDFGLEWYTGGSGYMAATPFAKKIKGFTTRENVTVPFSALAAYGVTFDSLSPTQQAAINARGGPGAATVVLQRDTNAEGYLKIKGLELSWVQPLDRFLWGVRGFGFSANFTRILQSTTGGVSGAVALGVPKTTYNLVGYYENKGFMIRLSQTFQEGSQVATANQNGITAAALYVDDYKQLDLSSSIDLGHVLGKTSNFWPQVTFDVTNLSREKQRTYFQFSNATFTEYAPGRTYAVGLRFRF